MDARDRRSGFTLLELMVALAVVSVVAAAAFRLQQQGARNILRARQLTEAVLLAQEKMVEFQLSPSPGREGKARAPSGEEFFWEVEVSGGPRPAVRTVRVRVRKEARGPALFDTLTYVAAP